MLPKLIALLLLLSSSTSALKDLKTVFEWKSLEYEFPMDIDRQYAVDNGLLKPNSGAPIDVDVEYKPNGNIRVFQTIPRFTDGIPFTLATVTKRSTSNGPSIAAYPNYQWHSANNADCQSITSAFRTKIDECNHLWVIDSGIANDVQVCPPQILVFDLRTDELIHRFQFPQHLYTQGKSLFITPAVDVRDPPPVGSCRHALVYVADVNQPGLVVYNSKQKNAWRIENPLMFPRAKWGNHSFNGETFTLMDGIFALNVSPRQDPIRLLYFHALANDREAAVPLAYIDNPSAAQDKQSTLFRVVGRRGVQSPMEAIDSKGNMFTSTEDPISIFVWNTKTPYIRPTFGVVANNPNQLNFVSGMKVIKNPNGQEELWASTLTYQKIAAGTINYQDVNFRILYCTTSDLLKFGRCTGTSRRNWSNMIDESSSNHTFAPKRTRRGFRNY